MTNGFDARLAEVLNAATQNVRRAVAANFMPAPKVEPPRPVLESLAKAVAPLQPVLERLDAMMPENWQGQRLAYKDMVRLMQEGLPLAWVPPADVIRQLLAADDASSRAVVLDDCRPEVLGACSDALAAVTDARFSAQRTLLEGCVRMTESGMFSGAEALAANVWDTLVRGLAFANPAWLTDRGWWPGYSKIGQSVPTVGVDDDATIGQFRKAAVFLPFAKALEEFRRQHPVPEGFNRHATAHAAGALQYTAANAVVALMLAVSVLREIDDQGYPVQLHA
ncbi:hypothetical protein [Streptomyces djakartensis]|uniref:Uncharacterized protein n=1 Tax=Streptomyces djakartensis TaxID=68193 RepID=A0ABQ3AJ49_9ACTN|nr:hypothetical protein [Streptomyces djakartensis]GGY52634.1 hypothetical protein GCM10010384_68050 [Streptomyces djakartensis]